MQVHDIKKQNGVRRQIPDLRPAHWIRQDTENTTVTSQGAKQAATAARIINPKKMTNIPYFASTMSRAFTDRSRKKPLAEFFLVMAGNIGRKPDSEMQPKAETSGTAG